MSLRYILVCVCICMCVCVDIMYCILAKEELTIDGISFVTHDLGGHETGYHGLNMQR